MAQLAPSEPPEPASRPWPKLLILALALHAWTLFVMWSQAFPRTTADSVPFKQPAYMRLHSDHFSLPTYEGRARHFELIFSYPTPVYIAFNYLVFKLFGFSLFTSLGADLVVHFLLVSLVTWLFWRLTGNSWLSALAVLALAHLFNPLGRPEELGILFFVGALASVALDKPRYWLTVLMLGLCGATTPGAAVAATIQVLAYVALVTGLTRIFWIRAVAIGGLAVLVSLACELIFIWPYASEAIEQFRHLSSINPWFSLRQVLRSEPLWGSLVVLSSLGALASAGYLLVARPEWLPLDSRIGRLVLVLALGIPISLFFNIYLGRPSYDYRISTFECLAVIWLTFSQWLARAPVRRTWLAVAGTLSLLVLAVLPSRDYARYFLASALAEPGGVSYPQAVETIRQVVPSTATIGGDTAVWAAVDDGRPFYAVRWVGLEHWPEYVVTTQWTKVPYVLQEPEWREMIEKSYDEVTPHGGDEAEACACHLLGFKLPIATGRCDWALRIWKRRTAEQ